VFDRLGVVDSRQAAALAARWRADQPVDPAEIADALDELADALDRLERGRAKVAELIAPVGQLRTAAAAGDDWLTRNDTDRRGAPVTPPP
jgi:hypothetical protein